MTEDLSKRNGFYLTLLAAILIVAITWAVENRQSWFVPESGNLKIFGDLGYFLAIGLLLKWNFVRRLSGVLYMVVFVIFLCTISFAPKGCLLTYVLLILFSAVISYLLTSSKHVKAYYQ